VERDGAPVVLYTTSCQARKPSGETDSTITAEIWGDAADGLVRLTFASFDEPGEWQVELEVNGEYLEEPIPMYVRPLYQRGPR
jgi:hypothetical protein